jgi:hypothetical protein
VVSPRRKKRCVLSRKDHRKHDADLQRLRESSRPNRAEKSFVASLSVEGSLGIAAGVLVFILDKMGVGGTLVYAVLFLTAAILCIHSVVRSEWASPDKRRKMLGGGITLALFAVFGCWLFLRTPTESETDRKLDELLESRAYSPEKLHAKYPGNYFIFEADYEDKPDKARLLKSTLGNLEFDFSVVRITKNATSRIELRLPDIRYKGELLMTNIYFQRS